MTGKEINSAIALFFIWLFQYTFVVLKLLKLIDLSWVWVFIPSWGGIVLALVFAILALIAGKINEFISK